MHPSKLPQKQSDAIISYVLYNYDNLIADYYENKTDYQLPLASLLQHTPLIPTSTYMHFIKSPELNSEPNPVHYMLKLNRALKSTLGTYFVDD